MREIRIKPFMLLYIDHRTETESFLTYDSFEVGLNEYERMEKGSLFTPIALINIEKSMVLIEGYGKRSVL